MAAVPITITGFIAGAGGEAQNVTIIGIASSPGLSVGGGPGSGYPDNSLPGAPPVAGWPGGGPGGAHPDHGLPGKPPVAGWPGGGPGGAHPDQGLPPMPTEPPPNGVKPPPPGGGWGYHPDYGWGYFPGASDKPHPPSLPGGGNRPDNSLPGSQPGVDNSLPRPGGRPDNSLPPHAQPK